jgi:hypothetical protein
LGGARRPPQAPSLRGPAKPWSSATAEGSVTKS